MFKHKYDKKYGLKVSKVSKIIEFMLLIVTLVCLGFGLYNLFISHNDYWAWVWAAIAFFLFNIYDDRKVNKLEKRIKELMGEYSIK
jgi:membrane protein YdbS with pleckstrin-like domain